MTEVPMCSLNKFTNVVFVIFEVLGKGQLCLVLRMVLVGQKVLVGLEDPGRSEGPGGVGRSWWDWKVLVGLEGEEACGCVLRAVARCSDQGGKEGGGGKVFPVVHSRPQSLVKGLLINHLNSQAAQTMHLAWA